ncbi:hypothetical protein, conserved [Leishmania tarentolae]|uniref:GOLD domain-containing protein n=1 Tax=Leishmania tarentolae TaxID=5689 RepID=A0A640KP33_LEITA|nr:hypothetical protein, conserved [Leishmania tarentolae]
MSVNVQMHVIPDPTRGVPENMMGDPIVKRALALFDKVQKLRRLQELTRYKEKGLRTPAERVKEHGLWWSIIQVVYFFVAAGGQLWLRRDFVEKRCSIGQRSV